MNEGLSTLRRIGNVSYRKISKYEFPHILKQLFDLLEYKNILFSDLDNARKTIVSNLEYWNAVHSRELRQGQHIILKNFTLTEWIPSSSGLYFTKDAQQARFEAKNYANIEYGEYSPMGKISMVKGGIGSIRLQPKIILDRKYNILGASSNGVTHEGIPIIINDLIFNEHIDQIKEYGSILGDFHGRIVLVPSNKIIYGNRIPKLCIELYRIKNLNKTKIPIEATVALAYRTDLSLDLSWTYKTMTPDKEDRSLQEASEWLLKYINRHSAEGAKSIVFSDYDEHVSWFQDIDFTSQAVFENKGINTELLIKYIEENNVNLGDNVIIGNGNIVISDVSNTDIQITT